MNKGLIRELGEWNRLEGMFRENFSETALGDRDFRKMKLREYDRIYRAYNGKVQTTDERALIVMLRFQRRKIRRTLYPGLLRRMFSQITGSVLRPSYIGKQAILQQNRARALDYGSKALPTGTEATTRQREERSPGQRTHIRKAMRGLKKARSQGKKRRGLRV